MSNTGENPTLLLDLHVENMCITHVSATNVTYVIPKQRCLQSEKQ